MSLKCQFWGVKFQNPSRTMVLTRSISEVWQPQVRKHEWRIGNWEHWGNEMNGSGLNPRPHWLIECKSVAMHRLFPLRWLSTLGWRPTYGAAERSPRRTESTPPAGEWMPQAWNKTESSPTWAQPNFSVGFVSVCSLCCFMRSLYDLRIVSNIPKATLQLRWAIDCVTTRS